MAVIIAMVTLLWLGSGQLVDTSPTATTESTKPSTELTSVRVRAISAQEFERTVMVRARTEANRQVDVRAEISGLVASEPLAEGSLVGAGEVICELAEEDRPLRLAEARAAVASAQLDYDGALRLKSSGYQSRAAIAAAKAKLQTAKADLKRSELELAQLKIRAPFDGVVDHRSVELGDLMQRGDVCARVLDLNPLLLAGRVSESELSQIHVGGKASARLSTGETVSGQLRYISRSSDEVTRTFRVEVAVPNPDYRLPSGITTRLSIPAGVVPAHLISASVLSLDDTGKIGVKIVNDEGRVEYVSVTLVGDHPQGVWVTGLPVDSRLITVGQEYVASGQVVAVSLENSEGQNQSGVLAAEREAETDRKGDGKVLGEKTDAAVPDARSGEKTGAPIDGAATRSPTTATSVDMAAMP